MKKYIKIFEEFSNSDLPTLRDVIHPDNFEDESQRELTIDATIATCELLEFSLPPDFVELDRLGLADQADRLTNLSIDSIVEVFNLIGLTHQNEKSVREFCHRFPGILTYDSDTDEYRRPENSREIKEVYIDSDSEFAEEIRVVLFEDSNGMRAVEWEDQNNLRYFMRRKDIESVINK